MPFNDFFHRLFGFGKAVFTCNSLHRSPKYLNAYNKWVAEQAYLKWTGSFFKAYHYQKGRINTSELRVQLVEESNLQGVLLFYDPGIGTQNFSFLHELLKQRIVALGYRLHSSDTRQICHKRYKEQVQRYALMPPASDVPGSDLCNQLYGTIHLDYVTVNKLPGYIRFVANTYTDPYFSKPLPFMELLEHVLQPKENHS